MDAQGADGPGVPNIPPMPEDGLGMTPTSDIQTQMVHNSRVTTNAIGQLAVSSSSSSSGPYEGTLSKALEGAVKMLGRPPSFGGGKTEVYDFLEFKEQLYNVLAYAGPKFTDAFKNLEQLGDDERVPERFASEEHQAMSTKLYSLLSSWLTGTTKQHARDPSIASSRNGFALWKSLLRIYQPSTRSRSLALMQAIHSYPNFSPGVSSVAQISKLEELVKDYERCSGQSYPREILLSTLLRCIPSPLKEHIHLQLTDRTTYAQVKESVLVYERTTRTWMPTQVYQPLENGQGQYLAAVENAPSGGRQQAMEVNRVEDKGKGWWKGKSKGRGKGKKGFGKTFGAFSAMHAGKGFRFGRGRGKGKGRGKGRGKGKGKKRGKGKKGKGKSKGKGKKGKGKRLGRTVCRICHQEEHWGNECPNRHSVRNVEAEEQNQGTENYVHNPPNQDQYPRPNVVESGSIRQTTSRPDPRVVTRRVRENFTEKRFYHNGTPPEEFPEVFPLNSETEEEEGDDIRILYARMVKAVDQEETNEAPVSSEDLEPITNPFYGRLPSPRFADSEEEVDESESLGVCKGCGSKLELTCEKPCRSDSSKYPRVPDLYPGEDRYLRLQRKLRSEGKPYDRQALDDAAKQESEWIQSHIDAEGEKKKECEVDRVRMVREEFHDLAEWFVMDETDGDDDWCVIEEPDTPEMIRAAQTEERVPEEGLDLIILDSGSDASLLPCDHLEAGKVSSGKTGILLEDAQRNQIKSAGVVTAVIDVEQGDCWTAPSISESFIVSEATDILLPMGRILKSGWRLEYDPRIAAGEQDLGAQHYLTVSSMVLVSPNGRAKARIFYKRNSCCLLGRISVIKSGRTELPDSTRRTGDSPGHGNSRSSTDSWTAVERSVSVKVPDEFTSLLDSHPEWQVDDHG